MSRLWPLIFCLFGSFIYKAESTCTFPSQLSGVWHGSDFGQAVFLTSQFSTSNKLMKVDSNSHIMSQFNVQTFHCDDSLGNLYYIKSEIFNQFFSQFRLTMCWNIISVTSDKILYYSATTVMLNTTNSRFLLRSASVSYSLGTDCIVTGPYDKTAVRVLVRDGGISSAKITCPSIFLGHFTYEFDSGSGNQCTGETNLDVCTDEAQLSYNYTMCSAEQAYSTDGVLNCVYYETSENITYVTVYNSDSSSLPDEQTNFRFTCYAISAKGNSSLTATQYPQGCYENQNSTGYLSPGALLTLAKTASCPVTTTENVLSAATVISIIVVLLLLIGGLSIGFYCWKKSKQSKKIRPDSLTVKAPPVEHFDRVGSSMSRCGAVSPYSPYPTLSEIAVFRFGPSPIPDCDGGETLGGTIAPGLPEEDIAEAIKKRFEIEMAMEADDAFFGPSRPITQGDPDNVSLPMYSENGMATPEPTRITEVFEQLKTQREDEQGSDQNDGYDLRDGNIHKTDNSNNKSDSQTKQSTDNNGLQGFSNKTLKNNHKENTSDEKDFIYASTTIEPDTLPIVSDDTK